MKELFASNSFHRVEASVDITQVKIYKIKDGVVCEMQDKEFARLWNVLCGMTDCRCTGPHNVYDADGNIYPIV